MNMNQNVYDVVYKIQTVLRKFSVRDLRPGKANMYEISCRIFDDMYDMICFYVPMSDVIIHDNGITCDVYLLHSEYDMYYYGIAEDSSDEILLAMHPVHRYAITDAYYEVYPERTYVPFDMMCINEKSINEDEHSFSISFLSALVLPNTFVTFSIPKKDLYWTHNEYAKDEAHIDLRHSLHTITYKNKSTRWKDKALEVSKKRLTRDFLDYKRSIYSKVPVREYQDFLKSEYEISHLFAE